MPPPKKTIARSLGEFFGHIVKGAKTRIDKDGDEVIREEISRTVEEEEHDGITLRRTTIEEVEIRKKAKPPRVDDRDDAGG